MYTEDSISEMTIDPPGTEAFSLLHGFNNSPLTIATGRVGTLTAELREPIQLAHIMFDNSVDSGEVFVDARGSSKGLTNTLGQRLMTGLVPAALFSQSSKQNPHFGVFYPPGVPFDLSVYNGSVVDIQSVVGLSRDPSAIPHDGYAGERNCMHIASGCDAPTVLAAGGANVITIRPLELTVPDRLILHFGASALNAIDDISVSSILCGSRELVTGGDIPAAYFLPRHQFNRTLSPVVDLPEGRRFIGAPPRFSQNAPLTITLTVAAASGAIGANAYACTINR